MPITIVESPPTPDLFVHRRSSTDDGIEREDPNAVPPAESEDQMTSTPALHYHSTGRIITIRPVEAEIPGIGNMASDGSQFADIFVAASRLIIYVPSRSKGISIPYKHITVHAIQRDPALGVYLQLEDIPFTLKSMAQKGNCDDTENMHTNSASKDEVDEGNGDEYGDDGELDGVLELFITALSGSDRAEQEADITNLFDALSVCSALNPDPEESETEQDGIEDGGMVRALSTGEDIFGDGHEWITAENVDQFRDVEVEGEDRIRFADVADSARFLDAEDEDEGPEENGDEDRKKLRRID
ncbi:regulator of volume decrease after cellular swelling-domain-containing protein [Lipomyces chichibuensis]|uniref:regulator of volume decrease after cellular swelling-domain-containing protein n=1 Tax=Lipomyces chichibuensis TaxID=1546026 RepID=UPI0033433CA9